MRDGYEHIENTYSLKALTEFIGDHPKYISIVSFNVNNPDSGIYYQIEEPRTMGTLSNIFLLLEYERQVAAELLNPRERIQSIEEITRFALPEISGESHRKALKHFENKENTLPTLDEVVTAMVETNDLATSDFLWFTLGKEKLRALMDTLELSSTDMPLPFSGLYLSIHPELSDTSQAISEREIIALATKLKTDKDFRKSTNKLFKDSRLNLSFIQERDALEHFPQTQPIEIASLMARLYNNELLSLEISKRVKDKMNWAFEGGAVKRSFSEYGALYDNRIGMLSGIDFGTSIYNGHTSAQAIFFDKLPVAFWLHLSANHMQEDYQQRLIWDPALYKTTEQETLPTN